MFDTFLNKFTCQPNGCWKWLGAKNHQGYGWFSFAEGRLAHRASYYFFKGKIPKSLSIDHLCRERDCVNPSHLEAVTIQENIKRSPLIGAHNLRKTHCPNGHPYSGANLIKRAGKRRCRVCCNQYAKDYYYAHKATW